MTASELQRIALRLSNNCWCRHWLNFNHPQNPRKMAIQVLSDEPNPDPTKSPAVIWKPQRVKDLEVLGFQVLDDNLLYEHWIYTIGRTNEDGTPYNGII